MPVKNLLNKVSEQGYAGLSDAEFDTLGKFVEANPQYKDVFNKVSDNGFSALSDAEFGMLKSIPASPAPAPSGYAGYSSPAQAKDLYTRVKFGGYSNLSSSDKELFDRQYASSQAARNGMSLEQARAYADANRTQHMESNGFLEDVKDLPRQFAELPGRMYQGTRDFLANYAGGPLSSLLSGADEYIAVPDSTSPTGERAVERMPGSSYAERVAADQPGEIARGERGEGLPGLLSDPMNLTMALPGVGEARVAQLASKLPLVGTRASLLAREYPVLATALGNGVVNAALAGSSSAIDPLQQRVSASDVASAGFSPLQQALAAGVTGSLLSGIGRKLQGSAIENYPGANKLENMKMGGTKNTGLVDMTEEERRRAYDLVTENNTFPTRKDFYKAAQGIIDETKPDFRRADAVFNSYRELGYPYGYIHTDDLGDVMRGQILKEAAPGGSLSTAVTEGDINAYLEPIIEANALTAKLGNAPTPENLERARRTAAMSERMGDLIPLETNQRAQDIVRKMTETEKHLPVSELGRTLGTLNQRIGGILSKNPSAESKMALAAHEGIINDMLSSEGKNIAALPLSKAPAHLRDLSNKELAAYLRDRYPNLNADQAREITALENLRTPLKDIPAAGAAYNDFLAENTRPNYAFASKMLKGVARQADAGTSMRIGMPLEFLPHFYTKVGSTYGAQASKYKLGKLLEKPGVANALVRGILGANYLYKNTRDSAE